MAGVGAKSGWLEATGNTAGFELGMIMSIHALQRFLSVGRSWRISLR